MYAYYLCPFHKWTELANGFYHLPIMEANIYFKNFSSYYYLHSPVSQWSSSICLSCPPQIPFLENDNNPLYRIYFMLNTILSAWVSYETDVVIAPILQMAQWNKEKLNNSPTVIQLMVAEPISKSRQPVSRAHIFLTSINPWNLAIHFSY